MTGLISDPIPLEPDRSFADYQTPSAWDGQDYFGGTNFVLNRGFDYLHPRGMLDANEANARFGIPDQLKFDGPTDSAVAEDRYFAKRDELTRETQSAIAPQDFWNKAGRFGAGFASQAIDPLNIAASFVPVVGEARIASALGRAGLTEATLAGRTAIRAATGAVKGAAGQALLEPLQWARAKSLQDDFGPVDALLDLGFGAALGGGLHVVAGALGGDSLGEAFTNSHAGKLAAAELETREAALRASVAQLADDRPVTVDTVFDAAQLRDFQQAATLDPALMQTHLQAALDNIRARGDAAQQAVRWALEQPPLPDTPEAVLSEAGMAAATAQAGAGAGEPGPLETAAGEPIRGIQRPRRAPKTLLQFVASKGGVRDEGGELAAMDLHKAKTGFQPGFGPVVRQRGLHPDNMRELAESAGFLKRPGEHETSTMRDFYDALEAEIKSGKDFGRAGEPVYDPEYEAHLRDLETQAAAEHPELSEEGLLEEFAKLAGRHLPEDIGSEGRHDPFDIPFDEIAPAAGDAGGEARGGAPDLGRAGPENGPAAEGAGRENPGAPGQGDERRSLDEGGQTVLPGAERISDKALAERGMEGRKAGSVPQKPADEGLFDVAGRGQSDLFADDPEVKAADEAAAKADLFAKAWDAAAGCMGSH